MTQNNQLAVAGAEQMAALEVRQQVNQLQYLMQQVLKQGEHYGVVPGTKGKPSLFQPGAEKICLMFKLVPRYHIEKTQLPGGHREVEVTCTLYQRGSEIVEGEGMGSCSTMERKYRYRNKWNNGVKTTEENPDIADTYNTVLKMAKKRALVDAVKSTTAASDIFTQDVEDLPEWMMGRQAPQQAPTPDPQPAQEVAPVEDLGWLRKATARLVELGYVEGEVKPYLWQRYKAGGMAEAQDAYAAMLAAAGDGGAEEAPTEASAGDAEPVEADEYEDQDIEF